MRKCFVPGRWPKPEPCTTVTYFWRISSVTKTSSPSGCRWLDMVESPRGATQLTRLVFGAPLHGEIAALRSLRFTSIK